MSGRGLSRWTRPLTVVAAMLITVVSVWLLGVLNVRATLGPQPRQRTRIIVIQGPQSRVDKQEPSRRTPPEPERLTEEIMEIDLDMPAERMPLEPLKLESTLPAPTIPPIEVTLSPPEASASTQSPAKKTTVHSAGKVDQPPREHRSNAQPPYPAAKLRSGGEGRVTLKLLIDESGAVKDVKVIDGEKEFVEAVMAVVFQWRFTPARNGGRPVKVWGLKRINFRLR